MCLAVVVYWFITFVCDTKNVSSILTYRLTFLLPMPLSFKTIISYVNQQVQLQKFIIAVPYTKFYLRFICFLYKENYLEFFYLKEKFIFFKIRCFAGRPSLRQMVPAQKKGQRKYLRLPCVHKSGTKNIGSMFFSTPLGTLNQKQAAKIKTGGLLACFLF